MVVFQGEDYMSQTRYTRRTSTSPRPCGASSRANGSNRRITIPLTRFSAPPGWALASVRKILFVNYSHYVA